MENCVSLVVSPGIARSWRRIQLTYRACAGLPVGRTPSRATKVFIFSSVVAFGSAAGSGAAGHEAAPAAPPVSTLASATAIATRNNIYGPPRRRSRHISGRAGAKSFAMQRPPN